MKPASQTSGEILNPYWFIGHLKCTAPPCVDSQPQSVRRRVKSGKTLQGIPDKMKKNIRNASKSSKYVWKYAFSPQLIITTQNCQLCQCESRSYTPNENPSYFVMKWSCMEAIQSFISHFNQYNLVDPSWANIPSWVAQGVSHWFRKLWRRVWHSRHFGN